MVGQYNPMSSQIVDTQPIFRRLVNLYLNEGVIGVCEDLYMKGRVQQIVCFMRLIVLTVSI